MAKQSFNELPKSSRDVQNSGGGVYDNNGLPKMSDEAEKKLDEKFDKIDSVLAPVKKGEESGGLFNGKGDDSKALGAGALGGAEKAIGGAAVAGGAVGAISKLAGAFGNNKKKTAAGGLSVGLVAIAVFGASVVAGPLEFIHLAKTLSEARLSSQQDESNFRLTKVFKSLYYAKKDEAYKTRMGIIGNAYADRIEARFNSVGLESKYSGRLGAFNGFAIDRNAPEYKGKNDPQLTEYVKEKYGIDIKITNGSALIPNDSGIFDFKGYFKTKNLIRTNLEESGYSKIGARMATRVIGQRYDLTLNPIKKLDAKITKTADQKLKAYTDRRSRQIDGDNKPIGGTASTPETDKDGKPIPGATENASTAEGQAKGALSVDPDSPGKLAAFSDSTSLKAAGGVAAIAGVACMAKGIDDNYDQVKEAQVVVPLMREAGRLLAIGGEIMNGKPNVDLLQQIGYESKTLYNKKTGQTWVNSSGIRKITDGTAKGVQPDTIVSSIAKGAPFAAVTSGPIGAALGPVCSTAGQVVVGVVGFLGGPVSFGLGTLASVIFVPTLVSHLVSFLAGKAVNLSDPNNWGPGIGTYADAGTKILADTQESAVGAVRLTAKQLGERSALETGLQQSEFNSQSVAYKLLNPYDPRSVASKLIDNITPSNSQNVASMLNATTNIGSMLSTVGNALTPKVHADSATDKTPLDYGLPTYGYTAAEMDAPEVDNPFENANQVADLLNSSAGKDIITRVQNCFNVTLVANQTYQGAQWDAVAGQGQLVMYGSKADDAYNANNCGDPGPQWLQVRMFISDTQTIKSVACYEGDDGICSELGAGSTTGDAAASTVQSTYGGDTSGQQCSAGTDNGVGDGYQNNEQFKIRLCNVQGIIVNAQISANLNNLLNAAHSAGMALSGGGFRSMEGQIAARKTNGCPDTYTAPASSCRVPTARPGYSNHQMGLAVDFTVGGTTLRAGTKEFNWMKSNAASYGLKNLPSESWHWSVDGK
ncbi:MAG: Curculin domain protein (mannose-binding) lectin [Candidatus Saccharibacteria bacterium]|nr:Curculin domain protein (mannose-binding) lectin [Candidatus Saccharibacteria bacterium]